MFKVDVSSSKEYFLFDPARYVGKLGELKVGRNNFSFEKFDDLEIDALKDLILEAQTIFTKDPIYQTRRVARPGVSRC
jgi:hypothetical protein